MKFLLILALTLTAHSSFAETGADLLLDQLGEKPAPKKTEAPTEIAPSAEVIPQGDAFQRQLAISLQAQTLSFDMHQWANSVLRGEFAKASHLWTAIQEQIPEGFRAQAETTQVYLLWKLGLKQLFFQQWIRNLANNGITHSTAELTFETLVTPHLDGWLLENPVVLNPSDLEVLRKLPSDRPFLQTLKAWGGLRDEAQARASIQVLPPENQLNPFLIETVVYHDMKAGDLKAAARTLKRVDEPAIAANKNLEMLATYDLSIARILYQAGQVQAAGEFYQKIPNRSPSYLAAREELAWVYLRLGDMSKLRGEIEALSSPVFKDRFQPEVYLLRAVSDLKMCLYENLDKDLNDFTRSNATWAKQIDQSLAAMATPAPTQPDAYSQIAERAVKRLNEEIKMVDTLTEQSVGATLPAVGPQKHWKDLKKQAQAALEQAQKRLQSEYSRQWKNQRTTLMEAIRKMRFVKVEYMSQVRQLAAGTEAAPGKLVATNSDTLPASAVIGEASGEQMNFPSSTEVWPDELFKLRSAAQARCLKKAGGK